MGTGLSEAIKLLLVLVGYGIVGGLLQMVTSYLEYKESLIKEYVAKLGLSEIRKDFRNHKWILLVSNILEVVAFAIIIVLTMYKVGNHGLFVMMVELGIGVYLVEVWLVHKLARQDLEWISQRVVAAKVFKNYAHPQLLGNLVKVLTEETVNNVMKDEDLRIYLRNMVKFRNREVRKDFNYVLKRYENKERMVSISKILLAEEVLMVEDNNSEGRNEGLYKVFKEMNEYLMEIPVVSSILAKEERMRLQTQTDAEKELKENTNWLTSAKFNK